MAPTNAVNDEQFRFIVKIMPPRRPKNSLFSRLQQPKVDEPLHTIAVPARPSESFADVWKHIRERYHRNYGKEEVAKAWFHKLQDRFGADIDSHDGVGALGYNSTTPKEDLVLVMLQNDIDRDGSVPETSGLRPPGFSRPELSAEQALEVKRRKDQEERYGAALEDVDEDTPIDSRERSQGPGSSQLGEDTASAKKVDADGFAVPALPGSITRKRKRTQKPDNDTIQSSIDEENEENILVPGSQATSRNIESVPNSFPDEPPASRSRSMRSMPADAASGASQRDHNVNRSRTVAPSNHGRRTSAAIPGKSALKESRLASLEAEARSLDRHTRNDADRPKSPPTPVSGVSQPVTQQPPESAQRPKQSQTSTSARNQPRLPSAGTDEVQNDDDFDPIEDDDLLSGIGGTADNDHNEYEFAPEEVPRKGIKNRMLSVFSKTIPGKLKKPNKLPTSTPKSSGIQLLSGTQGSVSKNPRSQSAGKNLWSVEEDSYILKGNRRGLNAAQIIKEFGLQDRSTSAVRGRHKILLAKHPELAYQRGVSEVPSEVFSNGPPSSRKRQAWPPGDIQIMSRAIANGYDSLEIQANHFPTRSEDAVARKVLSIQDGIWKSAAKSEWFPENRAQLDGWTLKDSCKLRRTFRENLPTQDAKNRFFGRWEMSDVQRQLNAYEAQVKEIASQQGRSMESARYDEDFLNASSQLPVNSSPVERSVQARAARRTSGDALQHRTLELGSSPPQQHANRLESQTVGRSSAPARRASSPRVEISSSEQENARNMLSLPPSGSGGQTTLNLTRDKGKKRAGAARPTDDELDAQYTRRTPAVNNSQPPKQPQRKSSDFDNQSEKSPAKDNLEEHTPMDDLDMLDAQLDTETQPTNQEKPSRTSANEITGSFTATETIEDESTPKRTSRVSQKSPFNASNKADMQTPGKVAIRQIPSTSRHMSYDNAQVESDRRSLLSPMETRGGRTPTTLSDERRRSRHQSGVDTRAAMQLSQELQRSLSSEEVEEAAQESQAFQTRDPATSRSQRIAAASKTMPLTQDSILPVGDASRSVNPGTSAFHRTSPRPAMAAQAPKAAQSSQHHLYAMEPSPRAGASNSNITPATTPGTTPARSGRLPVRGQSYASRIRDLQRSNKPPPSASSAEQDESWKEVTKPEESRVESRDEKSPSPTDASIWEKTANAAELGKNREEYFQDLRISTYSVRAMARGDWNEVQRLKAEERRLRRQRKLANGESTVSQQVYEHQDGPATGGDGQHADEDVIRADDYSRESSEAGEDDGDEKIWSDDNHEQPEEMDRERHFSEVKDDDEVANPHAETAPEESEEPSNAEGDHPIEATDDQEMSDPVEAFPEPEGRLVAQEEEDDDLELPTVATLPETNGDVRHALTDDNLQELNNSGAEGSPARLPRKRKANEVEATPSSKRDKPQSDDRAAMPPPQSNKPMSKRERRRKRAHRRHSESGSERSSSVSRQIMSSDGPQQHTPFTPINKEAVGHKAKKAKLSETTPNCSPEVSRATSTQRAAGASQGAFIKGSQRVNGVGGGGLSGLSGLVRKAHIPTPPRKKETPKAEQKSRKFDIRKEDDESESSADSD